MTTTGRSRSNKTTKSDVGVVTTQIDVTDEASDDTEGNDEIGADDDVRQPGRRRSRSGRRLAGPDTVLQSHDGSRFANSPVPMSRRSTFSTAALFVAATSVAAGVAAFFWVAAQGGRFSATAVVQLEPSSEIVDNRELVDIIGSIDRGPIVVTLAGVASSGSVTSAAQRQLNVTESQMESYEVDALQVLTSHLVDITVTGPVETVAVDYADAIASQLQRSFARSHPVYQITTITPATVPDDAGRPGPALTVGAVMLAAAIGAVMLWLALFGGSDERTDLPLPQRSL